VKKLSFLLAALVLAGTHIYAQEYKIALGAGPEWNMNSRKNFAGGAVLGFDYNLPKSFAAGLGFGINYNFSNVVVIEPAAMFRWYFLGKGHTGFFAQADIGAFFLQEDGEVYTYFLGGLRGGYRFQLKKSFYIEPYGRLGYPFAFGIGALAGYKFQ